MNNIDETLDDEIVVATSGSSRIIVGGVGMGMREAVKKVLEQNFESVVIVNSENLKEQEIPPGMVELLISDGEPNFVLDDIGTFFPNPSQNAKKRFKREKRFF